MSELTRCCRWCSLPAFRESGHIWLCYMHYRFQSMRTKAKYDGKEVPSYNDLKLLFDQLNPVMICPICRRPMNWMAKDGRSTVITLQHDRSGVLRLLCMGCNARHGQCEGDSFYSEIGPNRKRCWRCKQVKTLEEFSTDRGRWSEKGTTCKECLYILNKTWRTKNREKYNASKRAYRAKRKAAGNPVRGGSH